MADGRARVALLVDGEEILELTADGNDRSRALMLGRGGQR